MDSKPTRPWDLHDERKRRQLYAYFNRLQERKLGGIALTTAENLDLLQLGRAIAQYEKEEAESAVIQRATEALGAAEARLATVQRQLQQARDEEDDLHITNLEAQEGVLQLEVQEAKRYLEAVKRDPAAAVAAEAAEEEESPQGSDYTEAEGDDDDDDDDETEQPQQQGLPVLPPVRPPGAPGGGGGGDPAAAAVMADQNAPKGTELLTIPQYPGSGIDPELWIDLIERTARTYNWHNDRKAGAACMRMSEKALVWVDAQRKLGNVLENLEWDNFKRQFYIRFKPQEDTLKGTQALIDLNQKSGESVAEFFDRVCLAVEAKNKPSFTAAQRREEWYNTARSNDIYSFTCAGLNPTIRKIVMGSANPPRNMDDLRTMAVETEQALAAQKSINELSEKLDTSEIASVKEKGSGNDNDKDNDKVAMLEKEILAIKRGVRCYNCGEWGHIRRECPKKPTGQGQGQSQGSRGRGFQRGGYGGYGFGRGRGQGYYRGRGRGMPRGRGMSGWNYGQYGRGGQRPNFIPAANFGQPNYFQPQQSYPPVRYGVNQMQQQVPDNTQGMWEIVNTNNHLNY